jgi:menaquinone-9 beta-reductase
MASRCRVGIIGAGPGGLAAAIELSRLGVEGVELVDRLDFPRDKTCGSALSPKGVDTIRSLGLLDDVAAVGQWINGMRLVTPSGRELRMVGKSDAALICNRRVLDHMLLRHAQQQGVTFRPNSQVEHLLTRDDRVIGFASRDAVTRADYTIVADGAKSRFAVSRGPRTSLQTIMGWWDDFAHEPGLIDMVFDAAVSPLYGWMFPETDTRVNIGICYEDPGHDTNGRTLFQQFLDKHYRERLVGSRPCGAWKGHPISYSTGVERLTSPGRFVIGEAARMTHPATGEGIYQAMRSGIEAARAIASILNGQTSETDAQAVYQRACRSAFNASFKGGMVWRRCVKAGALDAVVRAANLPMVQKYLATTMAHM